MTTVDKAYELLKTFDGRSPRQVYTDACHKMCVKVNTAFAQALSEEVNDFYTMEDLDLSHNYFGPKGSLCIIPILQCQQTLKRVNLSGCGVGDQMITELVEVLMDHPKLRECDLSTNPDVSIYSGKALVKAVKHNVNIISLNVHGTHVGENVASVIDGLAAKNSKMMDDYFADDYFKIKDMFISLDVDGSGWANITNIAGNIPYPLVREILEERIRRMKPTKREDNCIDINTCMRLVYLNYKTKKQISAYAALCGGGGETASDAAGEDKEGEEQSGEKSRADVVDSEEGKAVLVEPWVRDQYKTTLTNFVTVLKALSKKDTAGIPADLHMLRLRHHALSDEEADKLVACALELGAQREPPQTSVTAELLGSAAKKCADELNLSPKRQTRRQFLYGQDDPKTWSLPPQLVRAVVKHFGDAPPHGITTDDFLDAKFELELEWLKLTLLRQRFTQHSIPTDCCFVTLEEAVNLLDEYYASIRVNKKLGVDEIKQLVA